MYTCYSSNAEKGHYTVKSQISEKQYNSIRRSFKYLVSISSDMDYWGLIDLNLTEMKHAFFRTYSNRTDKFVYINGSFSNLLSSYYLWKNHNTHNNNEIFKAIQSKYRKAHIECYLISELRNYLAHEGFAVSETVYDSLNEIMHFNVDPKDLVTFMNKGEHKPSASLKRYLNTLIASGQKIDIIPLVNRFEEIYGQMQREIWASFIEKVKEALSNILQIVPGKYPDLYNSYIIPDNNEKDEYLGTGHYLDGFVRKAQKYYPKFLIVDEDTLEQFS